MKTKIKLNSTWLNGVYTVSNHRVEINTSLPYLAFDGYRINFFSQGDDAETNINEIFEYWEANDCTIEEAIQWFIDTYLFY